MPRLRDIHPGMGHCALWRLGVHSMQWQSSLVTLFHQKKAQSPSIRRRGAFTSDAECQDGKARGEQGIAINKYLMPPRHVQILRHHHKIAFFFSIIGGELVLSASRQVFEWSDATRKKIQTTAFTGSNKHVARVSTMPFQEPLARGTISAQGFERWH